MANAFTQMYRPYGTCDGTLLFFFINIKSLAGLISTAKQDNQKNI